MNFKCPLSSIAFSIGLYESLKNSKVFHGTWKSYIEMESESRTGGFNQPSNSLTTYISELT